MSRRCDRSSSNRTRNVPAKQLDVEEHVLAAVDHVQLFGGQQDFPDRQRVGAHHHDWKQKTDLWSSRVDVNGIFEIYRGRRRRERGLREDGGFFEKA